MKQILVPTDFSPPSIEAYKFAVDIAAATNTAVTVLNAIDLPVMVAGFDVPVYTYDPALEADLENFAREQYQKLESLSATRGVPTSLDLRTGSVIRAIREKIREGNVELVVMGTHGTSGIDELLFGSNTEKVVRHSNVPVIAIRTAPSLSSIRKIVFPNNLEQGQSELVKRVVDLQRFFDATLHILWVNTPVHFTPDTQALEQLQKFALEHELSNYVLEVRSDVSEGEGIRNFVLKEKVDLVAMGTHGRKGLAHLVNDSVAEYVVNHIQCPIWTCEIDKNSI